jgi:hypothetical protein
MAGGLTVQIDTVEIVFQQNIFFFLFDVYAVQKLRASCSKVQ